MITCTGCKAEKTEEEFAWRIKDVKRQPRCKACNSAYRSGYYQDNKEKVLAYSKASRNSLLEYVREQKANPCTDCGVEYPYYVMQFDHTDPATKLGDLPTLIYNGKGKVVIDAEIAKCELVCANCHAERTNGPLKRNGLDKTSIIP